MSKYSLFKFFLYLAVAFSVGGFLLTSPTFAQSTTNTFLEKQSAIEQGNGFEAWTNEAFGNNLTSLFIGLNGTIPAEVINALGTTNATTFVPGGAIGQVNTFIAYLNTPPASGIQYIAQVKDSFLGKPAYAQGAGFTGLQFLLPLWRGFRNVIYVLASIIFIAIGIMIMLRVKISPQAVVTVQSAIPKLITTLILVTFSYAIAGLIIDFANFIQAIVISLAFNIQGTNINQPLFRDVWYHNFFTNTWESIKQFLNIEQIDGQNYTFTSLSNMDHNTLNSLLGRLIPKFVPSILLGIIAGKTILGLVGGILGGAGGLFLPVIVSILTFFWLLKLLFGLIKTYGTIIFDIILSPLQIGMGAFPNSKIGFSSWFLDLLAHVLVFPIVSIFIVLSNIIIDSIANTSGVSVPWSPNLLNFGDVLGIPGTAQLAIAAGFGLVSLSLLSKLPDMIPEFIFKLKPSPWGQAIGEGLDVHKMPVIGGIVRGTEHQGEEAVGGQVLTTGGEVITKAKTDIATVYNKVRTSNKHPQDVPDLD